MRAFLLIVFSALVLHSQTLSFEAVSIKVHPEPITVMRSDISGTYATWTATDLLSLVVDAYDLKYYQVFGSPPWATSTHFDIAARAGGETAPTKEQFGQLVEAMLAERFQLKVHREMRDLPVYLLLPGKNGSKLKDADPNGRRGSVMANTTGVHMDYSHNTMQQLADHLSSTAGRPVLDKTGLPGEYAFKLDFSINNGNEFELPGMVTAVQDQLGLRLESQKAPVEVLVIDGAEKPSEN